MLFFLNNVLFSFSTDYYTPITFSILFSIKLTIYLVYNGVYVKEKKFHKLYYYIFVSCITTEYRSQKNVIESALQSELRVVTSINVSLDKFMCKYFLKCDYSKVLHIVSSIFWKEKDFASYIDRIFTLNNRTR